MKDINRGYGMPVYCNGNDGDEVVGSSSRILQHWMSLATWVAGGEQ